MGIQQSWSTTPVNNGTADAGINAVQQVLIAEGDVKPPMKPVAALYDDSYVKEASKK